MEPGKSETPGEGSTESRPTSGKITVLELPLAAAQLSILRSATTPRLEFLRVMQELAIALLIEASRDWEATAIEVTTPLQICAGVRLTSPLVLVPILRAGLGMSDGMLREASHQPSVQHKQQVFLDFVLSQYVKIGVDELGAEKLTPLLRLRYNNAIHDAIAELGSAEEINRLFTGFQRYLYDRAA